MWENDIIFISQIKEERKNMISVTQYFEEHFSIAGGNIK